MVYRVKQLDIVTEKFDEGMLILRFPDRHLIALNSVAAVMLSETNGRHSLTQIARRVSRTFDVSESEAIDDAIDFFHMAIQKKLVDRVG